MTWYFDMRLSENNEMINDQFLIKEYSRAPLFQ